MLQYCYTSDKYIIILLRSVGHPHYYYHLNLSKKWYQIFFDKCIREPDGL